VDWLCFPRFDSPAIFASLLDPEGGHWSIRPLSGDIRTRRRYLKGSLALETTFHTASGEMVLTDTLALGRNKRGHQLGSEAPHALLREARCSRGEVEILSSFEARPEYGLVYPLFRPAEGGCLGQGGASLLRLSAPEPLEIHGSTVRTRLTLAQGEAASFAFQWGPTRGPPPKGWSREEIAEGIRDTREGWESWSEMHQRYDGPWKDLVHHSGRVLQGLTYYPTGAMVAAPTTSLPEALGGDRNWDYRYTWVRDASFTLHALWVAACPDEAQKFFDFLANTALTRMRREDRLQIMFGIGGEHDLTEREIPHLRGWRGSRPVRVGNDAWKQRQLDVYGELLDAAWRFREYLENMDTLTRQLLADMADSAANRWQEKDQGIWEVRGEPRHFLHSKLMCWVALDRGVRMAELLDARDRVDGWKAARHDIRERILAEGWNEELGSFTQVLGDGTLDASSLMIPIVGFLDGMDPRVRSTLEVTEEHLTDENGLVYRYRSEDGLTGDEGTFLLCTFWLAQAWALAGDKGRARSVFRRAAGFLNDVDLLAEEVDPSSRSFRGNFPQAFSHIGLVNAAWAIHK